MPSTARKRVVILPDLDHMLWHIRKEDFATNHIFGKTAVAKGAIAGSPGKQVWAIWVRRYYGHPDHIDEHEEEKNGGNVLYVLRLVVEGDETANIHHNKSQSPPPKEAYVEQTAAIKAVLRVAQAEAAEWRLNQVRLWEPSPWRGVFSSRAASMLIVLSAMVGASQVRCGSPAAATTKSQR
ncbi:uncharacterized protein PG998_005796 [Apiospora kogelbergensis]|uniref:uncharacterized protein n=1 Tax=Apiospora kogelbergensis TaxID=1337665 RepID=UPI00312F24A7